MVCCGKCNKRHDGRCCCTKPCCLWFHFYNIISLVVVVITSIFYIVFGGPFPTNAMAHAGMALLVGNSLSFIASFWSICFLKCERQNIMFALIFLTMMLTGTGLNCYASVFLFRTQYTSDEITEYCKNYFRYYAAPPPAMHFLQTVLPCCGGDSFQDFLFRVYDQKFTIPDSCCLEFDSNGDVIVFNHRVTFDWDTFITNRNVLADNKANKCGQNIGNFSMHQNLSNTINGIFGLRNNPPAVRKLIVDIIAIWFKGSNYKGNYSGYGPRSLHIIKHLRYARVSPFGCATIIRIFDELIRRVFPEHQKELIKFKEYRNIITEYKLLVSFTILLTVLNAVGVTIFLQYYLRYCGKSLEHKGLHTTDEDRAIHDNHLVDLEEENAQRKLDQLKERVRQLNKVHDVSSVSTIADDHSDIISNSSYHNESRHDYSSTGANVKPSHSIFSTSS